ncbi:hypothetical protein [Chitinophaga rhizophila]|uniref:TIGR04222 domain-containing membrane protein n=1 Tax=Chitinophaga rhizophila TaxID=2866212 RepID=A0ABS7G8C9_9BACT|nr:hypothetical protein [Chitinophaga rhizophila]MBW8682952.1 hypothetical protein [Chitinophaga rhizophila]
MNPMMQTHLPLWTKIQAFSFDNGTAVNTFAKKLAAEQQWTPDFTRRAIEEYKKFMLLCCISPTGAAPSNVVDEVWHLHLTYTQSYWTDFCKNTLGRDVHHYPSDGGTSEDYRHLAWYKRTRQLYRNIFETTPPEDIWPTPIDYVSIPDYPPVEWTTKLTVTFSMLALLPFLFSGMVYGELFPFYLKGPQFIWFFALFALSLLTIYLIYHIRSQEQVNRLLTAHFPEDASPFHIAAFVYGKGRAVQTGIVDLMKRGLLLTSKEGVFTVNKAGYIPQQQEKNPLIPGFELEDDQTEVDYKAISERWYTPADASHPIFIAMDQFASRNSGFIGLLHVLLYGVPVIRILQGWIHHKPFGYLIIGIILTAILCRVISRGCRRDLSMYKTAKALYEHKYGKPEEETDPVVHQFAVKGLSAVRDIPDVALLAGVFAAYSTVSFRNTFGEPEKKDFGGASGCGSSGSSCGSGGSSCGGSSCGGGCGGCGGGGD